MTQELISKKDTSSYTNGNGSYQNNLTNIKNSPAKSMAKQVPAVPKTSQANPMDKVVASVLTAVPAEMKKQGYAQKNVQLILEQCRATNMHDPHKVAYVLATAQHESKFGTPTYKRSESLVEDHNPYKFDSNTQKWSTHRGEKTLSADSEEQLDQEYWDDHYGGRLGNKKSSMDASNFRGRGFVQLTGRDNYKKMSNQLNKEGFTYTYDGVTYGSKDNPIDLVTHFDHVNKVQALAARILVSGMDEGSFSGRRMDQFINDKKTDYTGARKVVNGSDRAQQIADYAKRYEKVLTNQDAWKRVFDDEKTYGDSPIGRSSQASFLLSKNSPISHIVSSTAPTSTHTNLHSNGRNSFAKSPAPNLSADPAKTTVDNVSSSAIKEALKIHEIGSASPYKISYAEKGKSGGSFGATQGDVANNSLAKSTLEQVLRNAGADETRVLHILGQAGRKALQKNPLNPDDTKFVNNALNSTEGRKLVDEMDEKNFNTVIKNLGICLTAAKKAGRTITPTAQLYIALWVNMTGTPTTLVSYILGEPKLGLTPPSGATFTEDDIKKYLEANSYYKKNPKNFAHMQEAVQAGVGSPSNGGDKTH